MGNSAYSAYPAGIGFVAPCERWDTASYEGDGTRVPLVARGLRRPNHRAGAEKNF